MATSAPQLERAPVVDWPTFAAYFLSVWEQGQHCLFIGPNGSGKTVAARHFARARDYVCVLGTKVRDSQLDAYLDEGYVRIDHWPPTRADYRLGSRAGWAPGEARFVLWPHIRTRADLTARRGMYADALDDMFVDEGWTIVADEGLWLSTKLRLADQLDSIAYAGRSSDVTLMTLAQRPRGLPVNCWTNAIYAFIWHLGNSDDIRELASLGTKDRRAVTAQVAEMTEGAEDTPQRRHDFLFLPCRAGVRWGVSQVVMD